MVQRHSVLYFGFLIFRGFCTVLNHTFTSLADTYLLIKLFMLGPLDKKFYGGWVVVVVVVGDIAIIASSSRGPGET